MVSIANNERIENINKMFKDIYSDILTQSKNIYTVYNSVKSNEISFEEDFINKITEQINVLENNLDGIRALAKYPHIANVKVIDLSNPGGFDNQARDPKTGNMFNSDFFSYINTDAKSVSLPEIIAETTNITESIKLNVATSDKTAIVCSEKPSVQTIICECEFPVKTINTIVLNASSKSVFNVSLTHYKDSSGAWQSVSNVVYNNITNDVEIEFPEVTATGIRLSISLITCYGTNRYIGGNNYTAESAISGVLSKFFNTVSYYTEESKEFYGHYIYHFSYKSIKLLRKTKQNVAFLLSKPLTVPPLETVKLEASIVPDANTYPEYFLVIKDYKSNTSQLYTIPILPSDSLLSKEKLEVKGVNEMGLYNAPSGYTAAARINFEPSNRSDIGLSGGSPTFLIQSNRPKIVFFTHNTYDLSAQYTVSYEPKHLNYGFHTNVPSPAVVPSCNLSEEHHAYTGVIDTVNHTLAIELENSPTGNVTVQYYDENASSWVSGGADIVPAGRNVVVTSFNVVNDPSLSNRLYKFTYSCNNSINVGNFVNYYSPADNSIVRNIGDDVIKSEISLLVIIRSTNTATVSNMFAIKKLNLFYNTSENK